MLPLQLLRHRPRPGRAINNRQLISQSNVQLIRPYRMLLSRSGPPLTGHQRHSTKTAHCHRICSVFSSPHVLNPRKAAPDSSQTAWKETKRGKAHYSSQSSGRRGCRESCTVFHLWMPCQTVPPPAPPHLQTRQRLCPQIPISQKRKAPRTSHRH